MSKSENEYVLGTDQEELTRLKLQHELWKDEAISLWDETNWKERAAKIKLLDLGCGPGFTTLELSKYLGHQSQLTAVDLSQRFLSSLEREASQMKAPIQTLLSPIENLNLALNEFDGAYCRWLMIFVPDVLKALQSVHSHLKKGSNFLLQEYVGYETMSICPEVPVMKEIVQAIFKSWKEQGGDPNRGRVLPSLLSQAGFEIVSLKPIARIARPHEPLWNWPDSFYKSFLPRLVQTGHLKATQMEEFFQAWEKAKVEVGSYFLCPTMMNIVARKVA